MADKRRIASGILNVIRRLPGGHEVQIPLDMDTISLYRARRPDVFSIMKRSLNAIDRDDFSSMKSGGIEWVDNVSSILGCDAVALVDVVIIADYFRDGIEEDVNHE